jgi:hypothetical protein
MNNLYEQNDATMPEWLIKLDGIGWAINFDESPKWFIEYIKSQSDVQKVVALKFAHWLDQNHISVTSGGNGIIHNIDGLWDVYKEKYSK